MDQPEIPDIISFETFKSFFAGTVGGSAGLLVGQPFVKVRLQTQSSNNKFYDGTLDCLFKIFKDEGYKGFFKGMAGVAVINAIVFGVYENTMNILHNNENKQPKMKELFIAGTLAGIANSFVSAPLELVKIQMQNQKGKNKALNQFKGPIDCIKQIYRAGGLKLCYKGLGLTIGRELSYGPYFMTYEIVCQYLLKLFPPDHLKKHEINIKLKNASHELDGFQLIVAGGLAGISGWIVTYPIDVIKSRIQGQNFIIKIVTYKNSYQCANQLFKREGYKPFFAGLNAALLRSVPLNAATFFVYTNCMKFMSN